jgi:hypothetical protein
MSIKCAGSSGGRFGKDIRDIRVPKWSGKLSIGAGTSNESRNYRKLSGKTVKTFTSDAFPMGVIYFMVPRVFLPPTFFE